MINRLNIRIGFATAVFLAIAPFALTQTKMAPKKAPQAKAAGHQSAGTQNPSGHVNSIAVDHAGGNGVRRMDGGNSGVNPLYESAGKSVSKPTTGTSTSPQYKDPEDMTTRYRPGNNKTTTISPPRPKNGTTGTSTSPQYKDPEDMTTRYRPGNNKTTTTSPSRPKNGTTSSPQSLP